jgi:hypothetical protein
VFFLKGDPLGERRFVSRSFTIRTVRPNAASAPLLANGCSLTR